MATDHPDPRSDREKHEDDEQVAAEQDAGSVGSDPTPLDLYRWEYGGAYTPATASGNARFGAALAAAPVSYGTQVPLLAVGAPGEAKVYIYRPATTWTPGMMGASAAANPFDLAGAATEYVIDAASTVDGDGNPISALGFGGNVHLADLDADGIVDLVVAAPASDELTVFRGVGGTGNPFSAVPVVLEFSRRFATGTDLGAALVSGFLQEAPGSGVKPTLVAGAPGFSAPSGAAHERGAVCQYRFTGGFSQPVDRRCDDSPFIQPTGSSCPGGVGAPADFSVPQRFGSALAVGNFIRHDTFGSTSSPEARLEELAVGAPGAEVPGHFMFSFEDGVSAAGNCLTRYAYEPVGPAGGSVTIFESSFDGGAEISLVSKQHRYLQTVAPGTSEVGGAFGSALVAADLFPPTDMTDLVIGASGVNGGGTDRGEVLVTRTSDAVRGFMADYVGEYEALDSLNDPEMVRLIPVQVDGVGTRYTLVVYGFNFEIREGGGDPTEALCMYDDGNTSVNPDFDGTTEITARCGLWLRGRAASPCG